MSYDLQLLPRDRVDEFLHDEERGGQGRPEIQLETAAPQRRAWERRLAEALVAADPRFSPDFDFVPSARGGDIGDDRAQDGDVEFALDLPDDDPTGIHVTISGQSAFVTVPYWHEGAAAEAVFRQVWNYLTVLERAGGLATYDPQLGRVVDVGNDFDAVVRQYLGVTGRMREIVQ